MGIRLNLGSLQLSLDCERLLQEVECRAHLADPAVVASHVVVGHGLAELVVLAELLTLAQKVERRVDVLLLQVVDSKDVTNFAQLLAAAREFLRVRAEVGLLDLEELLEDTDGFNVLALYSKQIKRCLCIIRVLPLAGTVWRFAPTS